MKLDKIELDTINSYIGGIDKFIAIAKIQENEGKAMGALDAMLQAQELLFDLKDYVKRNNDSDAKIETFAEYCARDIKAEDKLRNRANGGQ